MVPPIAPSTWTRVPAVAAAAFASPIVRAVTVRVIAGGVGQRIAISAGSAGSG
jgi:hypothetical protein